jgi:predicted molibdopterin-dependent oxidoreductase YjgC
VLNQPQRLTRPYLWENGIKHYLTPTEAVQMAAEKLAECPPHLFGLALSADCTNEELYIARKFIQQVMNSPNIENLSRFAYGNSLRPTIRHLSNQANWEDLENAQVIFSIGFDGRYNQSVIGSKIKRAMQNGAILITLYPGLHHLSRHATIWINPHSGEEHLALHSLVAALQHHSSTSEDTWVGKTADFLLNHSKRVLLIGNQFLHQENSDLIFNAIDELLYTLPFATLTFPLQANLVGSLWLQTLSEFNYNLQPNSIQQQEKSNSTSWILKPDHLQENHNSSNFKVLFYLNTAPHQAFQQAEFTICQHISELDYFPSPALILPAAAFAEMDGSFFDGFGTYKTIQKAVQPPGEAAPSGNGYAKLHGKSGKVASIFIPSKISKMNFSSSLKRSKYITMKIVQLPLNGK